MTRFTKLTVAVGLAVMVLASTGCSNDGLPDGVTAGPGTSASGGATSSADNSGQTLTIPDGIATNAQSALGGIEKEWRASIADLGPSDANVSSDAACFYVLNAAGVATMQTVCGPVRRAGTDNGEVWDLYTLVAMPNQTESSTASTASGSASEIASASASSTSAPDVTYSLAQEQPDPQSGVVTPPGTLYRPDGTNAPDGAADLALPEKPKAPANLIGTVQMSNTPTTDPLPIDQAKATMVTPGATVQIQAVSHLDSVGTYTPLPGTQGPGDGADLVPADGHHLLAFTIETRVGLPDALDPATRVASDNDNLAPLPEPRYTLAVNGVDYDITPSLTGDDDYSSQEGNPVSFVASVKDGSHITLAASTDGVIQTMQVDTATRQPSAQGDRLQQVNMRTVVNATSPKFTKKYTSDTLTDRTSTLVYSASVKSVVFTTYSPKDGWAPDGKQWALVLMQEDAPDHNRVDVDYTGWVVTASGNKSKIHFDPTTGSVANGVTFIAPFLIPADAGKMTASFVTELMPIQSVWGGDDKTFHFKTKPFTFTAQRP